MTDSYCTLSVVTGFIQVRTRLKGTTSPLCDLAVSGIRDKVTEGRTITIAQPWLILRAHIFHIIHSNIIHCFLLSNLIGAACGIFNENKCSEQNILLKFVIDTASIMHFLILFHTSIHVLQYHNTSLYQRVLKRIVVSDLFHRVTHIIRSVMCFFLTHLDHLTEEYTYDPNQRTWQLTTKWIFWQIFKFFFLDFILGFAALMSRGQWVSESVSKKRCVCLFYWMAISKCLGCSIIHVMWLRTLYTILSNAYAYQWANLHSNLNLTNTKILKS